MAVFLRDDAVDGRYNQNPFNFLHFDISSIDLQLNNHSLPGSMSNLDFRNNLYMEAFENMYKATITHHRGLDISYEDCGHF